MSKQSAEDYLDKLLNSVNGEETEAPEMEEMGLEDAIYEPVEEITEEVTDFDDIFGDLTAQAEKEVKMASRRVSKSEADFLMEFEAELEGENFDDFLKTFDDEPVDVQIDPFAEPAPVSEDIPVGEEMPAEEEPAEMDVFSMVDEPVETEAFEVPENLFGTEEPSEPEDIPEVEESATMEDLLQDMFSEATFSEGEAPVELSDEMSAETPSEASSDTESFSLGGVDLGSLFDDVASETPAGDAPAPMDMGDDDVFSSLFGGSDGESGDSIDLGNMGEADLMSLLSGDELGDIGDMLSQGDVTEVPMDGLDAFAAFAEGEMAAAAPEETKKGKTKKKASKVKPGGFLDKLSTILFGLDEDEDETVSLGAKKAPSAGALSNENDAILASLDAEESGKKKKGKKEKKPKKEKAPKPKKEKKPKKIKEPKPKKEKKPAEIDNTPPLKKGPVLLICLMVASLFALVMLGTNLAGYAATVSSAKGSYDAGEYALAYKELVGLEIKADDMELYNQVATLATVDSELNAYYIFLENDRPVEAIDSLICAAGRCKINEENAEVYGCAGQMATLRKEVSNELAEKYGMTYEEAISLYELKDRDDYTIALHEKMKELGIPVE